MTNADREQKIKENELIKNPPKHRKRKTTVKSPLEQSVKEEKKYLCYACGTEYDQLEKNFIKSPHPMFAGNRGYIHVCKKCVDFFEIEFEKYHNNDSDAAVRHLCMYFGFYAGDGLINMSRKINRQQTRMTTLASKQGMTQFVGKTYDTYLKERESDSITSIEEFSQLKADGGINISNTTVERWGIGFSSEDYKALDEHYKMLKRQNPNCDNNQEIFIKDLCYIKIQQMEAMKGKTDKSVDAFDKLTKLYRDTFKQAGLKTVVETDASNEECLGVTLALIGQYTPEEYYKDKNLYKDFDKRGEYNERFIYRPLKNLLTGSAERDVEFCIEDDSN